jgi:hypothetical protein
LLYGAEVSAARQQRTSAGSVSFLDLTAVICPPADRCQVVGPTGLIRYRDASHLTATYAASLAPVLGARIAAVLGQQPAP